jgi:VanZ family protein
VAGSATGAAVWRDPDVVKAWLAVAAWGALIIWASGRSFAADRSADWIGGLLRLIWGDVGPETLRMANKMVRKAGHFVEYAGLGLLVFRAMRCTRRDWPLGGWAAFAVGFALVLGIADETRQSFLPERTGRLHDVAIDLVGASTAVAVASAAVRRREAVSSQARPERARM